jgi:hypothetical protein
MILRYISHIYAGGVAIAIILALVGFSPFITSVAANDGTAFIGFLSCSYFLAIILMLLLIAPIIRANVIAKLGSKFILLQTILLLPFIAWGTCTLISLYLHGI